MDTPAGSQAFRTSGAAYDAFMGRYSGPLALQFADAVELAAGHHALDVGCGPGALTGVLAARLGAASVRAVDPSPTFVTECAARHPGVEVRLAPAEELPFEDAVFDRVLAQLVLHFVTDPPAAAQEFRRVARPGGLVGACVWDFEGGMEMLRHFWAAATSVVPDAPDEARHLRFGRAGEIPALLDEAGFESVREITLHVESAYEGFDELWAGFLAGIGPAGAFLVSLPDDRQGAVRTALFARLGAPEGGFTLGATARCGIGRNPG